MDNLENDKIEVRVKLEYQDLEKFGIRQYYSGITGKIITFFGILSLVMLPFEIIPSYQEIGAMAFVSYFPTLIIAILFLGGMPIIIKFKYKKLLVQDKFMREEQKYIFSESGIIIYSDSSSLSFKWNEVYKAISEKQNIVIFISKNKAFIIPLRIFEGDTIRLEELKNILISNLPKNKLKIK